MATVAAVPGLSEHPPQVVRRLWDIAEANNWNADAIAAVIALESRWNPKAKNPTPGQTASGLLQWIDSSKARMGVTRQQVDKMGAYDQLALVERYYRQVGARPIVPGDYYLIPYGRPDAIGKPDSFVLDDCASSDTKQANRCKLNPGLQDGSGRITAGSVRSKVDRALSGVKRLNVPTWEMVLAWGLGA